MAFLTAEAKAKVLIRPGFLSGWNFKLYSKLKEALDTETALRRPALWLPVIAGCGAVVYLTADQEPQFWFCLALCSGFGVAARLARHNRAFFALFLALAAFFFGEVSAGLRAARVAAPVIEKVTITNLEGFIEEMDIRPRGARFILRVDSAEGLKTSETPFRVRLSTGKDIAFKAGDFLRVKARLLPPSRASIPGGYDFARDAWFAQLGAVGNALGKIESLPPPHRAPLDLTLMAAIDRGRNILAARVAQTIGGEAGAIGAAMVTGKRDYLADDTKEVIRQAGIFHIITISGVQMTLVAGIFFIGLRRMLSLSQTLALNYPIKKWAAGMAMAAALFYDIVSGSRVGTERAMIMTMIMLAAILLDRQALSMRNLSLAVLVIIIIQPEAILGASFQLSFAAVGALIAVYEGRMAQRIRERKEMFEIGGETKAVPRWREGLAEIIENLKNGPLGILAATFCATSATAAFMANDFHELSPYVLIGNPLTLTVIEIFAVPGAILGSLFFPIGLDGPVWHYVGLGISLIMMMARFIASLPASTIHLQAFAPWSIGFFALAVLSIILWRTPLFRAMALPFAAIGLCGAIAGPAFDLAVAPTGDAIAIRGADGKLAIIGPRPSAFAAEQWLRSDADGRALGPARQMGGCDKLGCIARLPDGRPVALVLNQAAFVEDCSRAEVVVTPLEAPSGCAVPVLIDRDRLKTTGALTLKMLNGQNAARLSGNSEEEAFERLEVPPSGEEWKITAARAIGEDRPWSRAPKRPWKDQLPPKPIVSEALDAPAPVQDQMEMESDKDRAETDAEMQLE